MEYLSEIYCSNIAVVLPIGRCEQGIKSNQTKYREAFVLSRSMAQLAFNWLRL